LQKKQAVRFLRTTQRSLREVAWALNLSFSVLSGWNRCFDEQMKVLHVPDRTGKASKITIEMVRAVVRAAEAVKAQGRGLRLQRFTAQLRTDYGIVLSRKKVREVLIANDLFAASTRKRRPRFYQSLRKQIPNGLVSLDGSELTVLLGKTAYKFNVELCVDVGSFAHTAFSVAEQESSHEVIKVLEAHRKAWGSPLGMLCDHSSSNLGKRSRDYLKGHGIELVPVGPGNPKGNGTDEGAFGQMKQVIGKIDLDVSSPRALARGVLEKMISIYITMRNRLSRRAEPLTPIENMKLPTDQVQRDLERQRLKDYLRSKKPSQEERRKLDRLHGLIRYHHIDMQPDALKRSERSIKAFEIEAIGAAEEAFIKAVNRSPQKQTLAYFFGILRNIQRQRDDEAYRSYCRQRYNEKVMVDLQRQQEQAQQSEHSVETIMEILVAAVNASIRIVKELAIKKARQWTHELLKLYSYPRALRKRFSDVLGAMTALTLEQKRKVWDLIEQFLDPKSTTESVTLVL
jgi:hypothetical protein